MFTPQAMALCDFYKFSHRPQYPKNTEVVSSIWTPRTCRIGGADGAVMYNLQAFNQEWLIDFFNEHFFKQPIDDVLKKYTRFVKYTLGDQNPEVKHIADLHDLGYVPLHIRALPEGTMVPIRVPMFTSQNTEKDFFWFTNWVETLMSCEIWQSINNATIAQVYKKLLHNYAMKTVGDASFVKFQGHDFSMRGMAGLYAATRSGSAHLLSFVGTDTAPSIEYTEHFYGADIEKELIGTSIPATEHSVMCAHGKDEHATFKFLITELYPKGFVSIVSDTWNYWDVLTKVVYDLRNVIVNRDGKVVIRPDSGDPVKIICGDPNGKTEAERKGTIEILWEIFGGTMTLKGYKQLDPHIGAIYGDSITTIIADKILSGLEAKGFASTNVVFGIGSFTYQHNTRDNLGQALKATACIVDGQERQMFKDPVTDSGVKKSPKGRIVVYRDLDTGVLKCQDGLSLLEEYPNDLLRTVFLDGKIQNFQTFSEIRNRLAECTGVPF